MGSPQRRMVFAGRGAPDTRFGRFLKFAQPDKETLMIYGRFFTVAAKYILLYNAFVGIHGTEQRGEGAGFMR